MAFFDLSPSVWMITPQETAQYGQMLRVSVVREILKARISARAFVRSKPRAMAPPTVVAFKKPRRESSMRHSPDRATEFLMLLDAWDVKRCRGHEAETDAR